MKFQGSYLPRNVTYYPCQVSYQEMFTYPVGNMKLSGIEMLYYMTCSWYGWNNTGSLVAL